MSVIEYILGGILILMSLIVVAVVLLQQGREANLGSISGGAISNEYIEGLFDNGIADHIDIFTYHPYGATPENFDTKKMSRLQAGETATYEYEIKFN